jgi:hypothetical protein
MKFQLENTYKILVQSVGPLNPATTLKSEESAFSHRVSRRTRTQFLQGLTILDEPRGRIQRKTWCM